MAVEIERKFLVAARDWATLGEGECYRQGYLARDPVTVRIRVAGERGYLTLKGRSTGISRSEFEYGIPLEDAEALLALCTTPLIEKTRYRIPHGQHVWEVDVFDGDNAGLVVAEIELASEDEPFQRPDWLGEEVSGDYRYSNSALAVTPYRQWSPR